MNDLANLVLSVGETLVHEGGRLLFGIALGRAKELLGTPRQLGTRQLALNRALQKKAVDGALLAGPRTGKEYAKFTLKKGLPTDQRPRTSAVENEPHSVDDFDGVIKEGYGKGDLKPLSCGRTGRELVLRRRRKTGMSGSGSLRQSRDLKSAQKRRQRSFIYRGLQAQKMPELSGT
jgi:hypothetical protein